MSLKWTLHLSVVEEFIYLHSCTQSNSEGRKHRDTEYQIFLYDVLGFHSAAYREPSRGVWLYSITLIVIDHQSIAMTINEQLIPVQVLSEFLYLYFDTLFHYTEWTIKPNKSQENGSSKASEFGNNWTQ